MDYLWIARRFAGWSSSSFSASVAYLRTLDYAGTPSKQASYSYCAIGSPFRQPPPLPTSSPPPTPTQQQQLQQSQPRQPQPQTPEQPTTPQRQTPEYPPSGDVIAAGISIQHEVTDRIRLHTCKSRLQSRASHGEVRRGTGGEQTSPGGVRRGTGGEQASPGGGNNGKMAPVDLEGTSDLHPPVSRSNRDPLHAVSDTVQAANSHLPEAVGSTSHESISARGARLQSNRSIGPSREATRHATTRRSSSSLRMWKVRPMLHEWHVSWAQP